MKAFKKHLGAFALVFLLMFVVSAKASAFSEEDFASLDFTDAKGFSTIITDMSGGHWSRSGALDPASLEHSGCVENIASYELLYLGDTVMSVTLHDLQSPPPQDTTSAVGALNGYYTAEFNMDDSHDVFVTGLTSRNLQPVQTELMAVRLENRYFNITNIDFIDTEKTGSSDSELCWAASCADILQYTGWGSAAGFSDADDIFEAYIRAFDDVAGNAYYGWQWFFSGYNAQQEESGWAHVKDGTYSTFTGWLPAYSPESLATVYDVKYDWSQIAGAFGSLEKCCGVSISLGWYGAITAGTAATPSRSGAMCWTPRQAERTDTRPSSSPTPIRTCTPQTDATRPTNIACLGCRPIPAITWTASSWTTVAVLPACLKALSSCSLTPAAFRRTTARETNSIALTS